MKPIVALLLLCATAAFADRAPVLKQIQVPHDYYFREMYLPQLTSGPSAPAWSADGKWLVYAMAGSLWKQRVDSDETQEITAGPGYDYQPDWSSDGKRIVFVRYLDDAMNLYALDVESGLVTPLTTGNDVNLEPRWSPDGKHLAYVSTKGTGHFHIFVDGKPWSAERKSKTARYYYSPFDQQLSPSWSPDSRALVYVDNPETGYGTGSLWIRALDRRGSARPVHREETNWKAAPDWSPDGRRILYSSYAGRQSNQLWIATADGRDYPLPLTFGDGDITHPRWSPDGTRIACVTNESKNTSIVIQDAVGGARHELKIAKRRYKRAMGQLQIALPVPARIAVLGSDGRAYAPDDAPVRGDDSFDRSVQPFETHYFQAQTADVMLPPGRASVTVWYGDAHAISLNEISIASGETKSITITPPALDIPAQFASWLSGDVHVHMNYGGTYRTEPNDLVEQARAEDLNVVFDLLVNKEQRVPDIARFSAKPDPASTGDVLLLHSQEYHTSTAGHLGLLGLDDHYIVPGFAAYPYTGAASPYPDNAAIADLAHEQHALVGYVHPFDLAPDPARDKTIMNELPIDVALGKVDYYEVVGFSNHRESAGVWYRLLNCGFHLPAAGGTDAMTNYASLRGPVGLARTYVLPGDGDREHAWLAGLKAGRSMATNGPLIGFSVESHGPGDEIALPGGGGELSYKGWLRSLTAIDHLDVVLNGEVVQSIAPGSSNEISGKIRIERSGWLVLRAWNQHATPDVFDLFPYATTSPVYVTVDGKGAHDAEDADFFLRWIDKVRASAAANRDYNTKAERDAVLAHIDAARRVFESKR